jgi:L-ascorbate metabolism protein UlaG (beta-lactamase superfamily)
MKDSNSIFGGVSPSVDQFYRRDVDGMLYVSHASILVSLNAKKFLFDPVLAKPPHLGSWLFYPEMQRDDRLLEVDGVFVSHQHQDHFDIDFLKLLPQSTPIYIVAGRPQFSEMLKREDIPFIELPENQKFDLGDGISCVGILHEYNGIDAALAISNGDFTVFHGNDCFVSNEKLKIIKEVYPHINVACIPFAYVHWYPFLLDEVDADWKEDEANRLINKYLNYGLQQVKFLRPDVAIPFGANMFYCDDISSAHNKAVLSPFDFKNYADTTEFILAKHILPLFSGDTILSIGGTQKRKLEIGQKEFSLEELHAGFERYLAYIREKGTGFDASAIEKLQAHELQDLAFILKRIDYLEPIPNQNIYISNIDDSSFGLIEIDLQNMAVVKRETTDESISFHHFRLTDLAYKAYMSQQYSLNEVVASSRFRLIRKPNKYCLDVLKIVNNAL